MAQNSGIFNLATVNQAIGAGTWPNSKATNIQLLVVGGGGGGAAGGGGAGGLQQGDSVPVTPGTSYSVTLGAGGASASGAASAGGATTFGFLSYANGGGGGQWRGQGSVTQAGSGGGGPADTSNSFPGAGYPGQGNPGGSDLSGYSAAPGGGGAGSAGDPVFRQFSATAYNGQGGIGVHSLISGSLVSYANGGAGAYSATNLSGAAGTGNGATGTSANGGSGTVIVSYPDTLAAATTTGSVTATTSGSGSIYFPDAGGSGGTSAPGYIRYTNTSALTIGTTGTFDFWIYPTRFSTNHHVIDQSANSGLLIYYDSSGNLFVGATSSGGGAAVSSSPLSLNTWTHVAVVFNSGTVTVYFNGTGKTLTGTTTGFNMTNTNTVSISGYQSIVGQYGVIGYLANVRIVKGVAVYTGNFTSPIAPLQATQPAGTNISAITGTSTSLLLNGVSGAFLADSSTNLYAPSSVSTSTAAPTWAILSPLTVAGYKNRVYTFTGTGTITF